MSDTQPASPLLLALDGARRAVAEHGAGLLGYAGVVSVRPGFLVKSGQLTEEPAVVVTVRPETAATSASSLPERLLGVPLQVLVADPLDLQLTQPVDTWDWLVQPRALEAAPEIGYTRPEDVELERVRLTGGLVCHVSPDVGWATLEPFLRDAEARLTVAMYDFYADHIVALFEELGAERPDLTLELILQTDPSKEGTVVERLRDAWGGRLDFTPAVVSGPRRVFAGSYHTKVAVRDGSAFWLSSGNWTPTSQPLIPAGPQPTLYNRGNREWHAIVEDAGLAATFEAFIRHDIAQARAALVGSLPEAAVELPDLFVPESALVLEAVFQQPAPFPPERFDAGVDVEPLMTPDNYTERVRELIEGAETSLYLQYSYVHMPHELDGFRALVDVVCEKIRDGLDVRIIVGGNQKPEHTQALQALGWKLGTVLRAQRSKLHNKGVLIDGKIALVGSQNWSRSGTQYNRDATLVFHNQDIARYFARIFLFDWDNLTRSPALPEVQPVIAPAGAVTPEGMVRVRWQDWYED